MSYKLYYVWKNIKRRHRDKSYRLSTAANLSVCPEWQHNYKAFHDWAIEAGYEVGLILDRIDNNKGYSPDNCRFVTPRESSNNTSKNVRLTAFGQNKTLAEWVRSDECVVDYPTLYNRIHNGCRLEKALTTSSKVYHHNRTLFETIKGGAGEQKKVA